VDEAMGFDLIPTSGQHPENPESEGFMVIHLLEQMLQKNPRDRITLSGVKASNLLHILVILYNQTVQPTETSMAAA
jgi:hypothetical protein